MKLLQKVQFKICLLLCQWRFGELVFGLEKSEWTRGKKKLCMLPCHEYYIYGTWRKKEVRSLKLWHGRKLIGGKQQRGEQIAEYGGLGDVYGGRISAFFGVKRDL